MSCCIILTLCSGADVCYTLKSCARWVGCDSVTAMLKMASNNHSAAVCLLPRCGIGFYKVVFWRVSVTSTAACVAASTMERLGSCVHAGKSYVVLETHSEAILGM